MTLGLGMKTSELIWQDSQHQELFKIIEELEVEDSDDPKLIAKLNTYVEQHFSLEEAYMKELNYPGMEKHVLAHNKFIARFNEIVNERPCFNSEFKKNVGAFLKSWLVNHILKIDKEFEEFVLNSQRK